MGKRRGKRSASYRKKLTKNRRSCTNVAKKGVVVTSTQRSPSPVPVDGADTLDCRQGETGGEINPGESTEANNDGSRKCTDCQRLRELLYVEQRLRKARVYYSECVPCQRKRQAVTGDAKQSLQGRMLSGETFGSRYLLAALAAKKRTSRVSTSKQL